MPIPNHPYDGLLMTEYFLVEGIQKVAAWKNPDAARFAAFCEGVRRGAGAVSESARVNESNTERRLIFPMLDLLGWKGAQFNRPNLADAIPDVVLASESREHWTQTGALSEAVSIVECKKWNLPLDRREGRSEAPSTQMLRYLSKAASLAKSPQWGILTNGRHWRLYWQGARSRSEEFLELDLRRIARDDCGDLDGGHWLRVFYLMFRREAFFPDPDLDRRTLHEHGVREGRLWESRITEGLSAELLDESLPGFARAVADKMEGDRSDPAFFERLREAVTTILFRLLFVLYAEDRELLPVTNRVYAGISLSGIRDEIAKRVDMSEPFSESVGQYFTKFSLLCRAVGAGDSAMGLPPYNGGLFAEDGRKLGGIELSDKRFAPLADQLSRRMSDGEKRRINYRDLSVRHLGAIYERLLLHEFTNHPKAGVQVRLSPQVRKVGGSYYTPDELTELVIARTVGPLLADKKRAWKDAVDRGASESEIRELDPAVAALNLKVCDPAMGSGHFLAALVDYVADRALEFVAEANARGFPSPLTAEINDTRGRIVENARAGGVELKEHLDDRLLIRRLALKRVIYGADKNPWAAELAKLSLWLHTFTVGAPLSFLDHHLRAGDSLFGEWIGKGIEWMDGWGIPLFTRAFLDSAREAAGHMAAVEARPDADLAQVRASAGDYEKFTRSGRKLNNLLRLVHGLRWMSAEDANLPRDERKRRANDRAAALSALFGNGGNDPAKALENWEAPKRGFPKAADIREIFARVDELHRRERFLHWESAFPGVWPLQNGEQWEGGFDAVVGNPPWERMKMQEVEWFYPRDPEVAAVKPAARRRAEIARRRERGDHWVRLYDIASRDAETSMKVARECGEYPDLSGGDTNLYALFVERALRLIRPTGRAGMLMPSGIYSDKTASPFFKRIAADGRISALLDFKNRPSTGGRNFFRDVHDDFRFCALILGGEKAKVGRTEMAFMLDRAAQADDPGRVIELSPDDFHLVNPETGNAPVFRNARDARIVLDIYRTRQTASAAWPTRQLRMIDPDKDSAVFKTAKRLEKAEYYRVTGNIYAGGKGGKAEPHYPLYGGRMMTHFNHRANSVAFNPDNPFRFNVSRPSTAEQLRDPGFLPEPPYWVPESRVTLPDGMDWAVGRRDITGEGNERTVVAAIIPRVACASTLPLVLPQLPPRPDGEEDSAAVRRWRKKREVALADYRAAAPLHVANLCSFALDFVCRQKIQGTHLSLFVLKQLPVLAASDYDRKFGPKTAAEIVRDHVLRLTYVSEDMRPFARDMGFNGDPFKWDEDARAHLRARLDALHFILYGIDNDDAEYILSTFPIVHRNDMAMHGRELTRELIPHYMNALKADDPDAQIVLPPVLPPRPIKPARKRKFLPRRGETQMDLESVGD